MKFLVILIDNELPRHKWTAYQSQKAKPKYTACDWEINPKEIQQ